jgi:transcription elongation GreA/GreB family factor
LLNHAEGDTIELATDEGKVRQVVIQKIEPHQIDLSVPA